MDELLMKLRILARAEITLARINSQRIANRIKLLSIAIGAVLLTVVMVNVGAYQLLAETYSNATAAFLVAAGNAALAIALVLAARQLQPGPEEQMVREIREMALAEVTADVDAIKQDFTEIGDNVKRIRTGFAGLSSGGGIGSWTGLASVVGMLVEALKRAKK
jgi:hypothetical protein